MKKGGATRPCYQRLHFTMETTTQDYLRKAAIEALSAKADSAALELLAMLHGRPAQPIAERATQALPAASPIIEGPPHDYHYWAQFIRKAFIPFLAENGRLRFTSPELFTWIENCAVAQLTTGDKCQCDDGKEHWRKIASNALSSLKKQGIIQAQAGGKDYEITAIALPAAPQSILSLL